MTSVPRQGPLHGVRVLDLTSIMLGPYLTRVLGDLGADVVKIEPPQGDVLRAAGPARTPGMGAPFLNLNRNKRSLVLDLKHERARGIMQSLVRTADVLVHGLRPGSIAKLGLAYEDLRAVNERLVYCAVYGYSERGPYAGKPAYDDLIQGAAALAALPQKYGEMPSYDPTPIVDRTTALTAAYSIVAALFHRERTGEGQAIDVTMFEVMADHVLTTHLGGATFEPPLAAPGYPRLLSPRRRPYRTRDGHVCVVCYTDEHWEKFFDLLGRADLKRDPRYRGERRAMNQGELNALMEEALANDTSAVWLQRLTAAGIPAIAMQTLDGLLEDRQLAATGFLAMAEHPSEGTLRTIGMPTSWSRTPPDIARHAPRLGQHSREVLREAGYTDADIDDYAASGVTHCARW
ncbi:MAG: CaiB/BaiF CoA transferase family protein [Rhodospirillaceae bacterium]